MTYLTINQFADKHIAFTRGGLRALIARASSNGLAQSGAIARIGRRILLNEPKFFAWIKELNGDA